MHRNLVPWILLAGALAGMLTFARGFELVHTVGLLMSGAVGGAAIAALVIARGKKR